MVFRDHMDRLLQQHDFLMLPCAPMSTLPAGADHSASRMNILRYTTPISLAGMPAVTLAAPAAECSWLQREAATPGCSLSRPAWGKD